jgi:phosphatidyl-myo-inositol dimannoside synthase
VSQVCRGGYWQQVLSVRRPPRLGLVVNEYSQAFGGMATVARAMVRYFHARGYELHLFTNTQCEPDPLIPTHPILTTDLARDLPRLARFKMDLWHSVNYGYAPLAAFCRPFVLTVHGNDFLSPWVRFKLARIPWLWRLGQDGVDQHWARKLVDPAALRCVDQVIAVSRFTADLFRSEFPYGRPPIAIPNGVEECFVDPPAGEPIEVRRHPRRLLSVSGLSGWRRKNIDGVIQAMALVGDRLDLEYCIVGDGTARPALEELATELGVSRRVRFLGRLSEEDLRQAYRSASLFVLAPRPTPGDVEGFGLVYLEAAGAGTPSLGTRFGGTTDAISEGESGFFADDASPEAIARALERFFTGQIRFDAGMVRAHARCHTWPAVLRRVEAIYACVCPQVREWLDSPLPLTSSLTSPLPEIEPGPEPSPALRG